MNRVTAVGGIVTAASVGTYALAIDVAVPGRAFTVTGVMLGLALVGVGVGRDG